jgi:hypothetical protein
VLLAVTAFVTIATAGQILWVGFSRWTVAAQTLRVLNQLLIVLMLVEILHTVRISIRSHVLDAKRSAFPGDLELLPHPFCVYQPILSLLVTVLTFNSPLR